MKWYKLGIKAPSQFYVCVLSIIPSTLYHSVPLCTSCCNSSITSNLQCTAENSTSQWKRQNKQQQHNNQFIHSTVIISYWTMHGWQSFLHVHHIIGSISVEWFDNRNYCTKSLAHIIDIVKCLAMKAVVTPFTPSTADATGVSECAISTTASNEYVSAFCKQKN